MLVPVSKPLLSLGKFRVISLVTVFLWRVIDCVLCWCFSVVEYVKGMVNIYYLYGVCVTLHISTQVRMKYATRNDNYTEKAYYLTLNHQLVSD